MKKLTAEKCQSVIDGFKWMVSEGPGMSIRDEYDLQAYQIALSVLEQQEKEAAQKIYDSGWIDWKGGDCPVAPDTIVTLKLFDDSVWHEYPAKEWNWHDTTHLDHIIAYRVIENDGREG